VPFVSAGNYNFVRRLLENIELCKKIDCIMTHETEEVHNHAYCGIGSYSAMLSISIRGIIRVMLVPF
jgi:hypothetical protein